MSPILGLVCSAVVWDNVLMYKRLIVFCGAVIVVGAIVVAVILIAPKPPIPGDIKKQVTSTIIVPNTSDGSTVDRSKVTYDASLKLLVFPVQVDNIRVVISEQPTPESFTDIPAVYDKVIDSSNEYTKFDVSIGTVNLTRPSDLKGKQAAIMNTKGTLMFAKPDSDLTDDQWRKFFNTMTTVE